jgi:GNAT superfamily N-acetyltransferase
VNIHKSTLEERKLLETKLIAFNGESVPFVRNEVWTCLSKVLKDDSGQVIAGINAGLNGWNVMHVGILFVDSAYRGLGHGKHLLQSTEIEAKELGGYMSHLDTFDFQAKDFYARLGYEAFGVLDYPQHKQRQFSAASSGMGRGH